MQAAILILCIISLALYLGGVVIARSYDDAKQRIGFTSILAGIAVFALTGVLSTGYVLWSLLA